MGWTTIWKILQPRSENIFSWCQLDWLDRVNIWLALPSPHYPGCYTSLKVFHLSTLLTLDDLPDEVIDDLISTMEVFLTSKSREIARSAIGFIKVALVTLPKEVMERRLEKLIPNLMVWSHETKGHFRVKVKSLMERMIRKLGYETILKYTPEEDRKLLINIRKTRERKKRGKEAMEEEVEEDTAKVISLSEFSDI